MIMQHFSHNLSHYYIMIWYYIMSGYYIITLCSKPLLHDVSVILLD